MILRRLANRYLFAVVLVLGIGTSVLAQPDKANPAAQNDIDAASALMEKGTKDAFREAIARLDHALELLKGIDSSQAADAYFMRASSKMNVGVTAISDLERFIALSPDNPTHLFLGNGLIATEYVNAQNDAAALPFLEQVSEHIKEGNYEKLDPTIATSELGLGLIRIAGHVFLRGKDGRKALDALWRAYLISDKISNEKAIAALQEYSDALVTLNDPEHAVPFLESALKRAIDAKLKRQQAEIANSIGKIYLYNLDDFAKAGPFLEKAMRLAEELQSNVLLYRTLNDVGEYQFRNINFPMAVSYWERALKIAASTEDSAGDQSVILYNLSQVYAGNGDQARSDATLSAALEKAKVGHQPLIEGSALMDQIIRRLERDSGNVDLKWLTDNVGHAIGLVKDLPGGQKQISEWLLSLGVTAIRVGIPDQAITTLENGLAHARVWGFRYQEAALLQNLAIAQNIKGDHRGAVINLNAALAAARTMGAQALEGRSLEHLMFTWNEIGNPSLAIFYGKNAINIYQQFRKNAGAADPGSGKGVMASFADAYRMLADILIQQGRLSEAERVLTLLKQEELIDYVRRDDVVAKHMLETLPISEDERAAISRYEQLADKITAAGKEFDDLDRERKLAGTQAFSKQQRYDELQQQLADATTAFQKYLDELKLKFGQKDSRVAEVDSGLKTTLRSMKADRTAVVSTIVGEDSLNIIVTTSRTQRAHTVAVGAKAVNQLVAKFREGLTSPKFDPRPASQQLYDLLVKPIEGDLAGIKADTVVWSLDGTLRYIPPAALWDKDHGYLVERFANVIINLASRDKIKDMPDKSAKLSVLGVGVSKPVDGFAPLAAVPDELDCIVEDKVAGILSAKPECRSGVLDGKKLLDDKFTLASFEGELGRYPIVHIATHFKLTPGDDKNSFILLGGGADKRFTVDRLRSEQSLADIDLIVLSACNTATPGGEKANGIEIEGFGSIAQDEGAKAVMASLWPVADASTKDLMVEFYRLYGKEGRSKAEAIRAAQLKLLRGGYPADSTTTSRGVPFAATGSSLPVFTPDSKAPFAHPYYWSPFILIGNWQ